MKNSLLQQYNNYIIESIEKDINPLVNIIIHKPSVYAWVKRWKIYKFKKFLLSYYTPSFDFLASIYDFIIIMENLLIYENSTNNSIYAARGLKNGVKSFRLNAYINNDTEYGNKNQYIIDYTLYTDRSICITIKRSWGDGVKTCIKFIDGQDMLLSTYDQIMFDRIISDTMRSVVYVFEECYENFKAIPLNEISQNDKFVHD